MITTILITDVDTYNDNFDSSLNNDYYDDSKDNDDDNGNGKIT